MDPLDGDSLSIAACGTNVRGVGRPMLLARDQVLYKPAPPTVKHLRSLASRTGDEDTTPTGLSLLPSVDVVALIDMMKASASD